MYIKWNNCFNTNSVALDIVYSHGNRNLPGYGLAC